MQITPRHLHVLCRAAFTIVLFSGVALRAHGARAGAFNQEEGKGQVIVTGMFSTADQGYDITGKLTAASRFQKTEATALVEAAEQPRTDPEHAEPSPSPDAPSGYDDSAAGMVRHAASSSMKRASPNSSSPRIASGAPSAAYTGLGATEIGAQAQLYRQGPFAFAVQAMARIPGAPDSSNLALQGNTRVEEELRALAGYGFQLGSWSSFANAEIGYRWRNGPPSEWHGDFTLGVRPVEKVMLMLQSFNTISGPSTSVIFPRNSLSKLQGSVVYDFTKAISGQIGAFESIAGENALKERGVIAAVWYRF